MRDDDDEDVVNVKELELNVTLFHWLSLSTTSMHRLDLCILQCICANNYYLLN